MPCTNDEQAHALSLLSGLGVSVLPERWAMSLYWAEARERPIDGRLLAYRYMMDLTALL